jgi:CheY-like chemotaxis protein
MTSTIFSPAFFGNACLTRAELPRESPLQSYIEQIEISSQRAADLCKQMLAYSGKGRFTVKRVGLGALVTETVHLLQLSISKKATLKLELMEHLPPVMADATQLRQIIMNLVMNASDALGDKPGEITIRTSVVQADKRILAGAVGADALEEGKYVLLEVTDTGSGMNPETQAKIFEPFFTTKFTGRGLGLAAVLGIVRGHKGALKVESELGRGTKFKLLLRAEQVLPEDSRKKPRVTPRWRGRGTVLVVDDEQSVRRVAGRMLMAMGFQVVMAGDGAEAINAYRAYADHICAVLLDLTMPRMDGEETFREIRRLRPDACVILMSGFSEQEAVARFVGKGLAGCLQKPFTPEELRERLTAFGAEGAGEPNSAVLECGA